MIRGHVDEFYTAYLENTLPEPLRQEVESHLHECPQCAMELAELCQVVESLHELPTIAAPGDFAESIRTVLPKESLRRVPVWRMMFPKLATAALLVLIAVGFWQINKSYRLQRQTVATAPKTTVESADDMGTPRTEIGGMAQPDIINDAAKAKGAGVPAPQATANPTLDPDKPAEKNEQLVYASPVATPGNQEVTRAKVMPATDAPPASTNTTFRAEHQASPSIAATPADPYSVRPMMSENRSAEPMASPQPAPSYSFTDRASDGAETAKATAPRTRLAGGTAIQLAQGDGQTLQLGDIVVQANAVSISGESPGNVQLVVQNSAPVTLRLNGASSQWQNSQQLTFDPPGGTAMIEVPSGGNGGSFKLAFDKGGTTQSAYLFTPGVGPRLTTVNVRATNQSMIQILQQLSNDAGLYIFAPGDFAQRTVTLSLRQSPISLLNTLASQQGAQALHAGKIVTITPR